MMDGFHTQMRWTGLPGCETRTGWPGQDPSPSWSGLTSAPGSSSTSTSSTAPAYYTPSRSSQAPEEAGGVHRRPSRSPYEQYGEVRHSDAESAFPRRKFEEAIRDTVSSFISGGSSSPLVEKRAWELVRDIADQQQRARRSPAGRQDKSRRKLRDSPYRNLAFRDRKMRDVDVIQPSSWSLDGSGNTGQRGPTDSSIDQYENGGKDYGLTSTKRNSVGRLSPSHRLDIALRASSDIESSPIAPPKRSPSNRAIQKVPRRRGRPSEREGISCSNCAIKKKKCTGKGTPCDLCANSKIPLYRNLCVEANFKGSRQLFHSLYGTRIKDLERNVIRYHQQGPQSYPLRIRISSGFDAQLALDLQAYDAQDYGKLVHKIFRGLEPGMEVPTAQSTAFALQDGTLSNEKIDQYCDKLAQAIIYDLRWKSFDNNTLSNHVLAFASLQVHLEDSSQMIEGIEMVRLALRFWAIQAIFFTYPWRVEKGADLIHMSPLPLPGYWYGVTLLPRLVNQELDRAFEGRMDEIETEILERLQHAMFKNHRNNWCAIFLTVFILLHSLEKDTWNMSAWDYETNSRNSAGWPLSKTPSEYVEQNEHIARMLAAHFKIVNQGTSPLDQDWSKPLNRQLLSNSRSAQGFIRSLQDDFRDPNSRYKADLARPVEFSRHDVQSLDYSYARELFWNDSETVGVT